MAFAAVVSVEQILNQLILNSDNLFHCDDFPISEIKNFHLQILSLRSSIEKIYPVRKIIRDEVKEFESKMRDTVYESQDLIEAFISGHTPQSIFLQTLKQNAKKLEHDAETAKKILDSMNKEQHQTISETENDQKTVSKSSRANESSKIVGQDEDLKKLKGLILKDTVADRQVISIWGLPGIGKTTLARSIFVDREVGDRFSIRSWVTVGEEYNAGEIFLKLLASIEGKGRKSDHGGSEVNHGNVEQIAIQLYNSLLHNRYLIVVDDVWGNKVWDRINNYFPDNKNCSRVILTTRIDRIAGQVKSDFRHEMKLLSPETSWELLREKVFGDGGHCPPDLLDIGPSIARHCGGLPLSITVVGGQLSQEMENLEYWKMVEEDTKVASQSQQNAYLQILSRSYEHLPGRLKGCFLYMGSFPEDSEILVSRLLKLWVAEGFLFQPSSSSTSSSSVSLEEIAEQCLMDLVDRNLIIPLKLCSSGKIKTCGTHDSIRHLAERKSEEESFFVSVKKFPAQRNQPPGEDADALKRKEAQRTAQRRLSVHKNILMCMEDVYKSAKLIKPARTLLFVGHYHHHPLPFCLTYDLLRVLDALTIHLIKFPNELVQLIHLRYLSLTFNGKLPASLSQLKNLLVLIVRRYPNIIIMGNSILPVEIWDMKQLRHVLLTECDFPRLPDIQAGSSPPLLGNLQSLSNINISTCCSKEFFDNMPNLKKLGIWIEVPGPVNVYLDQLPNLEAFKFAVLNPIPGKEIELQRDLFLPKTLKKLSLSGCGLSWAHMAAVGTFPCLQVLKLRQFAFQGKEWMPEEEQFPELKYLLIEYLDLEYMCVDHLGCGNLENLIIKNCYELKMVHEDLKKIGTLKRVEMIGCNKAVVNCVKDMLDDVSKDGRKVALLSNFSWGKLC